MKTKKIDHSLLRMIVFMIILLSLFLLNSVKAQEINIDSMYYSDVDSTALAEKVKADEALFHWIDTLEESSYQTIDAAIRKIKKRYKSIPILANEITAPYDKEEDKIRAIFIWVSNNIAYDCAEYHNKNRKIDGVSIPRNASKELRTAKKEEMYYKYASKVLRKRKGICEGYATLFYELCKYSNIKSEVVIGKVKKERNGKTRYFGHAWNKVYMNEEWFYLDVTWASGACDDKVTKYNKSFMNYYYLTPVKRPFDSHIANEKLTKKRNDLVGNY